MTATGPAVAYDLQNDGPALFPRAASRCPWCDDGRCGGPGSSCPVVRVPLCDLSPVRHRLREALS